MNDKPTLPPGVELPPEDLLKAADEEVGITVLTSVVLQDGSDHWAYLMVEPSRYMEFKEAEIRGNYNLRDYGTVLSHGEGKEPPEDIKKKMEVIFNVNHNFEEEVIEVYGALRKRVAEEQKIMLEAMEEDAKQKDKDRLLSKYAGKKKPRPSE